jgi:isopentenyl diphosphate isomerase/L-lactate dehydrogenase-like FMN-dependent dehydrogenase
MLAPVAHQGLVHCRGELATVEAADVMEAGFVASSFSSQPLEAIAALTSQPKWFQVYFHSSREQTLMRIRRAEAAGYEALVVTVDVPINGLRNRIQRSSFSLPPSAQDLEADGLNSVPIELSSEQSVIFQGLMTQAPCWLDIKWLCEQTHLPVLIKGVSHPEDALRAIAIGAKGIVVSNHGGRSLDTLPAAIKLLPEIRRALGNDVVIILDGGIRRGTDVFKALALGANAVMIGRPQVYALAVAGALGVAHMIKIIRDELEVAMVLSGCSSINDIGPHCLFHCD